MTTQGRAILGAVSAVAACGGSGLAAEYKVWSITILTGLMALVLAIITNPVIAASERES